MFRPNNPNRASHIWPYPPRNARTAMPVSELSKATIRGAAILTSFLYTRHAGRHCDVQNPLFIRLEMAYLGLPMRNLSKHIFPLFLKVFLVLFCRGPQRVRLKTGTAIYFGTLGHRWQRLPSPQSRIEKVWV